jgi:CRISPR/Cas system-associated endoribonuclease Cas2
MDNDIEIFKGKKFSDLCKDIYTNSQNTRNQIDILVSELRGLIKGVNDAITIVPMVKDYLDVGVRNDDQLVKLAGIIQRIASRQITAEASGNPFELSEEERNQLMSEVNKLSSDEKNKLSVEDIVSGAKLKMENS